MNTPEECTADTIKSVTIRVYPIGEIAALVKKWAFKMIDRVVMGSASDDTGDVNEPNNGGQTGGGSNTGGNNTGNGGGSNTGNNGGSTGNGGTQTPTEVTYSFDYLDGTNDTRTGLPGEPVNAPEPDEGNHWNETVPSVFGSVNKTFTEVANSATLDKSEGVDVKWTWHKDNGGGLAKELIIAPGSTVDPSEWPEAHEGYHWNSTPEELNLNVPGKSAGDWYYIREQPDE